MKPTQPPFVSQKQRCAALGFSLIELMVVLVLIGILSLVAIPKMLNNPAATLDAQAKTFASDLRRAQLLAGVRGVSLCVLASGISYSVVSQCAQPASVITDPANGQPFARTLTNGVTFTNAAIAPPLEFNNLGQPSQAAAYIVSPSNGAINFHVNVTALTGYVSITVTTP
jgi:prepilin-type N-terminal cleavage/methylation domain-containing protein